MTLVPVPESRLDDLLPILKRRVAEIDVEKEAANMLAERPSADVYLDYVRAGYARRLVAAYVDSLDDPHHILVLSHFPDIWSKNIVCTVSLIYSDKEHRGSYANVKQMVKTAEAYALLFGATLIMASSFDMGDNKRIGSLWKRLGYVETNTTYMKIR